MRMTAGDEATDDDQLPAAVIELLRRPVEPAARFLAARERFDETRAETTTA